MLMMFETRDVENLSKVPGRSFTIKAVFLSFSPSGISDVLRIDLKTAARFFAPGTRLH